MPEQLTAMTKAVAVALDIAGRPDTDDSYALNSVRKAYSLLKGARFQDFIEQSANTPRAHDYGFDWMEAYRLEAGKCDALVDQVRELEAQISKANASVSSPKEQVSAPSKNVASERPGSTQRTERVRERIVAALGDCDYTGQELSRTAKVHLRTVQRRLKELISDGLVHQVTDDLSPRYALTKKPVN